MNPIRLLIVDDHKLVRAGIISLLKEIQDVKVVAEADNGHDALKLMETRSPDLVLMDVAMRGLNGLETLARIARKYPRARVIILSMHSNEEYVIQALEAGACGYLLKDASPQELEIAVKAAMEGETYLSPKISKQVIDSYLKRAHGTATILLTPRQREIVQLIAEGCSTKEIASKLNLAVRTVETHRADIMKRLDIHDTAGLVRYAIRTGIATSDT
ncbi:MAG TPA: response regulator transcription factor [Pyrinomonadaceae bacterium]|nr:response regulator transcription factor [Pyrinomonadaceae bacterium]